MNRVEEIIGDLLLRLNCVIIPEFGGFVTQKTSAKIDSKNGIISPPSKSLLFNRLLINNDGLLISELSVKNEISFEEARIEVLQIVHQWNAELSAGKRISIDKVGFLFLDQERNICFEQDRYFNLLLSSFGLGNVHFLTETDVAIAQHTAEQREKVRISVAPLELFTIENKEQIATAHKETVQESTVFEKGTTVMHVVGKSNFWKYAAVACAIPILFYSFWIPMKTNVLESKLISFHDFNPFKKQEQAVYTKHSVKNLIPQQKEHLITLKEQLESIESNEDIYSYNLSDETYILVKVNKSLTGLEVSPEVEQNNTENPTSVVLTSQKALNYIVGCFSDNSNAENLVKDLQSKGFNASIKDVSAGLTRVTIGSANSQDELNELISKATAAGFSGWVLK